MYEWFISEENFLKWLELNLKFLEYEDWRGPDPKVTTHPEMFKQYSEKNIFPPDFKLYLKTNNSYICWVDVKWTQSVKDRKYNLNDKHALDYRLINRKTTLPIYIAVFENDNLEYPSWWAHLNFDDPKFNNRKIKLTEGETFKDELMKNII
ncbi:MAG: hypothetical protein HWN67_16690 [Candidatus Helarchaeota archaeon]|nr:hypothetical protein [Candidatus Helarchaeota archaeon]